MTPEEIDRAMRVYLGIGDSGGIQPVGMQERLTSAYGESRAPALERTLQDYLDQMMAMPVDWKAETLEAASERAASFAKELVPGLTPSTYAGMSKYFAYQWR
jgi:hypothetical protein